MANSWLRLWHDLPNDPKWRTIARASGQRIPDVLAVYLHLLVDASKNNPRGEASISSEDIACALGIGETVVQSIFAAMQGRIVTVDEATKRLKLSDWEARQPLREDGAAGRAKAWRDGQKEAQTQPNATERNRTLDKDKDKDKEEPITPSAIGGVKPPPGVSKIILAMFAKELPELSQPRLWSDHRRKAVEGVWKIVLEDLKNRDQPHGDDDVIAFFERTFRGVSKSDFLMGRVVGWSADFDWLMKKVNFLRVIEGRFEGSQPARGAA
jgi:hypothetical protein